MGESLVPESSRRGGVPLRLRGGSVVGEEVGGDVVIVGVVEGPAYWWQHHVGVARELGYLTTAGLRFPGTKENLYLFQNPWSLM